MAVTNPSWNLSNADVTRLRNARDIVASILPVWSADGRYSPQVPMLEGLRDGLNAVAQMVEDYLAVQGT